MLNVQLKDGEVHVALPGHMRAICGAERVRNDDVVSTALPTCERCIELVVEVTDEQLANAAR
jgi:hypothetical protein